ncbi:ABC transporter ATP-binding protein [Tuwongella immobilis]|uniref:ABC transporter domain-containing protein n=1 Tax=Tuwongella immobilis TaxID=692036 RepID=A0A6C2YNS6_9BACT|nr:ABC transporter ATP-binding protein [Tuwongella immobilis]VIP03044.1 abc transporter atp-binding protein : ABC transporter related protein OS=Jannaschia sp. (strain CCS1) GN=Jann_3107 PE=3 SV=1: ABC_tran [Tuwongella immobilis]VTS03219.1 abc transporter atp-binding protein : ABC transporter related protein OS=Jannaschia sp. (strain CCS1) GN=Jann_3107 PE=3 SV=1: ABC_tran [Tuwongella immobilis]
MIELTDIRFRYPASPFELNIPRLTIAAGERVAMIGPSGSGKTSLLQLMAGLLTPQSGRITVLGQELTQLTEPERRAFRICRLGMVFQHFALIDYLSVRENILLPFRINPALKRPTDSEERLSRFAAKLGIAALLDRNVRRLSQGEQQRVAVCRAMVPHPEIVLADEPTGNLDPTIKEAVMDAIGQLCDDIGATLITVTHDHQLLPRFRRIIDFAELLRLDRSAPSTLADASASVSASPGGISS